MYGIIFIIQNLADYVKILTKFQVKILSNIVRRLTNPI